MASEDQKRNVQKQPGHLLQKWPKRSIPDLRFLWLLFVFVLAPGRTVHGQVKGYVGFKGGALVSSAYIEHTIYNSFINTGFIPGYQGGMMVKLFTNQNPGSFLNAGLQSGLTVVRKGWRQTFPSDEPSYRVQMSYLELPIEALAYAGKGKTKFFFTLGIYTEYLLSVNKDEDPNPANLGGAEFYTYEKSRDRVFGYGGRGSAGVQRDFGFGLIHLDAYFGFSISSFIRTENLDDRLPDLTNHYQFGFTIAYLLPFGKMDF